VRILLIDDDEAARGFLKRAFERAGHEVRLAVDGRGVRELLETCRPDVVFTDIFMPEVDGFEALASLRQAAPGLPVVVMTGAAPAFGNCLGMAKLLGATAILEKPVKIAALLEALRVATAARPGDAPTPAS